MIKMEKSHVPVAANSHAGMSGKNNEDNYLVTAYEMNEFNPARVMLAVLCDGVGGHQAGEVASEIGVNVITEEIANSNGENIPRILTSAIQKASQSVNQQAQNNISGPGRAGMGSTTSVACLIGNRLYTATVGDSRVYLIRNGTIQQLSKDHTWIQDALDVGLITPEQVPGHPNTHVIRRYLGGPNLPEVDLRMYLYGYENDEQAEANQGARLQKKDYLLFCSDGLTDLVKAEEVLEIVEEHGMDMNSAVDALIDLANARGGHDNITIILFFVPEDIGIDPQDQPAPPPKIVEPAPEPTSNPKKKSGCLAMFVLPIIGLAAIFWVGTAIL